MSKHNVSEFEGREASVDPSTELLPAAHRSWSSRPYRLSCMPALSRIPIIAPRLAMRAWFAMAISRSARFKPVSGR